MSAKVAIFFLWDYIKDKVYLHPLLTTTKELRTMTVPDVNANMLTHVWDEPGYRWDVCSLSGSSDIEHVKNINFINELGTLHQYDVHHIIFTALFILEL
jgi:hypothetical protein